MYKLKIIKEIENKEYEEQMKEVKNSYINGVHRPELPPKKIDKQILDVEVNEGEWEAIKKAVIEVIK